MSRRDVLLAIHNFSELKSLANNAKMKSLLKFLLIWYLLARTCIPQKDKFNSKQHCKQFSPMGHPFPSVFIFSAIFQLGYCDVMIHICLIHFVMKNIQYK